MSGARSKSVGAPRSEEAVQATRTRPIFFNALTEQQRDACIRRMAAVTHSKGEEIVTQGALGTSMYFIDTGMAVATVSGRQVSTFMPGDFFGEQVFIATVGHLLDAILAEREDRRAARACADTADRSDDADIRRSATVRATSACRCLELSVKDFMSILDGDHVAQQSAVRLLLDAAATRFSRQQVLRPMPLVYWQSSSSLRAWLYPAESVQPCCEQQLRRGEGTRQSVNQSGAGAKSCQSEEQTTAFLQLWVRADDHSVLDLMTDDSRVQCISRMRLRAFAKGEKIVERAQPNSSIFFLKSGCALVMRNAQVCESRGWLSLKYCI